MDSGFLCCVERQTHYYMVCFGPISIISLDSILDILYTCGNHKVTMLELIKSNV